jgi:dsRNA-specific ribonuclease
VQTEVLLEATRPTAEITEALIGGCHLTFGFERTRSAVLAAFEPQIQAGIKKPLDPKSLLQNLLARRSTTVTYEVLSESNAPRWKVAAIVDFERVGEGEGRTKKEGEHAAAEDALESLDAEAAAPAVGLYMTLIRNSFASIYKALLRNGKRVRISAGD